MSLLADPIVDTLLVEFRETVDKLVEASIRGVDDEVRIRVIRQLCELSRDTRFQLGPPEYAVIEQVQQVAECFESSVTKIKNLWSAGSIPEIVETYCKNILQRAQRCRIA